MPGIFTILIVYGLPTWVGLVTLNLIKGGEKRFGGPEKYALALGIGTGLISLFMLNIGILKIPITFGSVATLFFISIPLSLICFKKRGAKGFFSWGFIRGKISNQRPLWQNIILIVIAVLIVWKIIYICFFSLSVPPFFDDPVSRWNYKAKIFFTNQSLVLNPSNPDFLGGTALRYPLGNSLFKTWTALAEGEWTEHYINLYGVAIYLAMLIVSYYRFRASLNIFFSLIFTYLLGSIPLLVFHSGTGHTDGILGFYFSCSLIYLFDGLREDYPGYLVIASILTVIALFTKAEALSYFISGTLPLLGCYLIFGRKVPFTRRLTFAGLYLLPVVALLFPWFWLKKVCNIVQTLPARRYALEFHPEGFSIIFRDLFNSGNFNILWTGIVLVILCGLKRIMKTDLIWLFIACLGLTVNLIFFHIFTSLFEFLKIGTQFNRLILHILPLYVFLAARVVGLWVPRDVEA